MAISKTYTTAFADMMDKSLMDTFMKHHPTGPPDTVSCWHCEKRNEPFSQAILNLCPHCCGKGIMAVPPSDVL